MGDLGRGGPGDTGRSIWLELVSGLSGGLSSSGGDGVLASRRGPESLGEKMEPDDKARRHLIGWPMSEVIHLLPPR